MENKKNEDDCRVLCSMAQIRNDQSGEEVRTFRQVLSCLNGTRPTLCHHILHAAIAVCGVMCTSVD